MWLLAAVQPTLICFCLSKSCYMTRHLGYRLTLIVESDIYYNLCKSIIRYYSQNNSFLTDSPLTSSIINMPWIRLMDQSIFFRGWKSISDNIFVSYFWEPFLPVRQTRFSGLPLGMSLVLGQTKASTWKTIHLWEKTTHDWDTACLENKNTLFPPSASENTMLLLLDLGYILSLSLSTRCMTSLWNNDIKSYKQKRKTQKNFKMFQSIAFHNILNTGATQKYKAFISNKSIWSRRQG